MCMLEKRLRYSGIITIDLYNVRYGGYCLAGTLLCRNAKCLCISQCVKCCVLGLSVL